MRRHGRRLGRVLAYALYLIGFVLAADYVFFWRPFVADLRTRRRSEPERPQQVEWQTMRRLGALRPDRKSSFVGFSPGRGADVIRVCAFGDSFTYGDEVADGHDYPTFLQQRFDEDGIGNVEVLNFGNSWYGFHQAYILWDAVGRRFGCDYVLLGPDCFQPDRDTTFNHSHLSQPYYLHARYVLDAGDVRLVDVIGTTPDEQFDSYFAFLPPWQYARYDRNPAAIVQAVLPAGRSVPNPLYYDRRSAEQEAYATYDVLLRKMAGTGVQILLLHSLAGVVDVANAIGNPALVGVYVPRTERYPYNAPGGHYSAFGNWLLAEQYYALLVDRGASTSVLQFEDLDGSTSRVATEPPPALSRFARIETRLGGRPAGFLATASANPALRGGTAADLRDAGVTAAIAFKSPQTSVVDAAFVPVERSVRADQPVSVRLKRGGSVDEREIGRLHIIDSAVNIGVVDVPGLEFAGDLFLHEEPQSADTGVRTDGIEVTVLVDSQAVLHGRADHWPVRLLPIAGPLRGFRVDASQYVDVRGLPPSGVVTLALVRTDDSTVEVPLARWRKGASLPPEAGRRLPRLITPTNPRAVLGAPPAEHLARRLASP